MSDDHWFHRYRQLDWKDQQDATARELERIRLRGDPAIRRTRSGDPDDDIGDEDSSLDSTSEKVLACVLETRWGLVDAIQRLPLDSMRIDRWISTLRESGPYRREYQRAVQAITCEIETMQSTAPGMFLFPRELESIHAKLTTLSDLIDHWHLLGEE